MKIKIKKSTSIFFILVFIILAVYSFILSYFVFWGAITSLKNVDDYLYESALSMPKGMPWNWEWKNYQIVYENFYVSRIVDGVKVKFDMWTMVFNSIMYAVVCSLIGAFVPYLVSYITAKYDYVFCRFITAMVIVLIALPIVGSTPSMIRILNALGIYDTWFSMILMRFNFLNTYYLIYFASWKSIPNEYREAASIDGASEWCIMTRIMFPMLIKMFFTIFLLMFVAAWNDYQTPLLYLKSSPVLAVGVYDVSRSNVGGILSNTPMRMASSMILLVPILILFIAFNKRLMGNLSMGGLKE